MTLHFRSATARRLRAVLFWTVLSTAGFVACIHPGYAQPAGSHGDTASANELAGPRWADLTPAQREALAPLAPEWDKLESFRKKKWLTIGNRFPSMKPAQRERLQERMREWVKLTPEQRRIVRENYARSKRLNRDQKSAQWQKYQQLSEDQKRKLAADAAASRKHVTTIPAPTAQRNRPLPPIKSTSKRVLERSVTPQEATLSPSPQPLPAGDKK